MKFIKFYLASLAIALCAGFSSCSDEYDDSEIWNKVNELLNRVQKLEASIQQQNSNIAALQTMLDAIKNNIYVTSVEELSDGKGYSLKFSNGEEVKIYHGENGKDGKSPVITIIKEGNNYYWSVNGDILKDEEGNNIPADGGADEILPQLKSGSQLEAEGVSGTWEKDAVYVTTDNVTWKKVNVGSNETGSSIFTSVEISEDGTTVIITLSDGSTIVVPKSEKLLQLLVGSWKKTDNNGYFNDNDESNDIIYVFNADYTLEIEGCPGTYSFVPDRYIKGTFVYDGEEYNKIWSIVEVTETTLTLLGDDKEFSGSFSRVIEKEFDKNVILGEWTCTEYDSGGDLQEIFTITFKDNGKLEISSDRLVVDTTWNYYEDGRFTMGIYHSVGDNYNATAYSATPDNVLNPTYFTGTHYWWTSNSNGIGSSGPKCKFTLSKK